MYEVDPEKQMDREQKGYKEEPLLLIKPDELPHQVEVDGRKDNDGISGRASPNGDKEDQSGSSVKGATCSRPTLLSVMIGVHWKHAVKNGQCLHVYLIYRCNCVYMSIVWCHYTVSVGSA